ncbi:hypothetical protein V6245_06155 [Salinibacterium amurskyense]|uniref:hypothetical protein n=1 Tax=Salinibacterium amurskyense TaxID=205941 RepID=UPI00311FC46F
MTWFMAWGTKREVVKETQLGKAESQFDDDILTYKRELAGYLFEVTYYFDEETLQAIDIEYTDVFDDDAEAFAVWAALDKKLADELGEPVKVFERDRDSFGEDDLAYWSPGEYTSFRWSVFQNETTRAVSRLSGTSDYLLSAGAKVVKR